MVSAIERKVSLPETDPGPLQTNELQPELIQRGLLIANPEGGVSAVGGDTGLTPVSNRWPDRSNDDAQNRQPSFPAMLDMLFQDQLETPETVFVQPKWVAGGVFELDCDFNKYVRARDLVKNEGLILPHLLRLIILAGEFLTLSEGDPDYRRIVELATQACTTVDRRYTDRFLESEAQARSLSPTSG